MIGKVTLVGAGPGDAGLLTIKGLNALKNADVVIYDRLVGNDILNLIPDSAEMIDAGKRSADHKIPQQKINELLLEKALEGKAVVRLKGGDCFLFGRGGEELILLAKNNVPFEVIPGITSALAVPAYAGIPVTHRSFVSSVHIITGHQKESEPLKINFKSCVECGGTLVFLMGVANLGKIALGLMENGMSCNMPCAVIENGTTTRQRKVLGTLSTIEDKCRQYAIQSPAIIVVGEVCSLSSKFDWFDSLPLKGVRVLVTRPKQRLNVLSEKLRLLGAEVIQCPCIETESIIEDYDTRELLNKINAYNTAVFTSPAGVKAVFDKLYKNNVDVRAIANVRLAVIGEGTAAELKKYGAFADLMPNEYNGNALGRLIAENECGKVLLLRAKEGSRDITDVLDDNNIVYEDMPVYKINYIANAIDIDYLDYITFTSASTVKAFTSVNGDFSCIKALCIGEKTQETAKEYGFQTIVSKKATIDAMLEALVKEVGKCQ